MEEFLVWLLRSVDPSRAHEVDAYLSWHARIMVLAWGGVAPLAVVIARYFKILPSQDWPNELDNPTWWRVHWIGQSGVVTLSVVGLVLILAAEPVPRTAGAHRLLGYCIVILGLAQAASGYLRGTKGGPTQPAPDGSWSGDHYDMTPRRLAFEAVHKSLGYILLLAAAICILLGLWAANAPNWMWLVILGWWAALILAAIWLQQTHGAYDTYQAIWGPDPAHPGNRMRKRGLGTVRPGMSDRVWGKK